MADPLIISPSFEGKLSGNIEDYPGGIIIPIDKPYRWTSADVVRKVKFALQKHFNKKNLKVGHAGTLDPLATGVLIVCAGNATKLAESLQAEQKEYIATISFGATTPSFDLEKPIDNFYPYSHITKELIAKELKQFLGEQQQIPPLFSAKMVNGTRAYEMARSGEEVELKSSLIRIDELEIVDFDPQHITAATQNPIRAKADNEMPPADHTLQDSAPRPQCTIRIGCSKGTYVRSFARDLGLAVGSGAYLTDLKRTISGNFHIKNSISLDFFITIT
ncbi:MAG: tRNA pseudouridine(55) synthase TruB [Bacteroidales bacterium]|nr:tRNA pseudouridine(55) synthase TruB [Bacteroidales bacterium]